MPVGAFLTHKPFRKTPKFHGHISSSFKRQNENTMITQTWKQISHYHGYVLDAVTSAELRKLATKVQLVKAECSVRSYDIMKGWNKLNPSKGQQEQGKAAVKPFFLNRTKVTLVLTSSKHLPAPSRTGSWHIESSG